MHCWIELNASALRHNAATLRQVAPNAHFAPILKSNAYGHGLKEVFGLLRDIDLSWIGVAYLEEAELLRAEGYKGQIMMVAPVEASEFPKAVSLDAEIFMTHDALLTDWLVAKQKPKIHVKFDTGLTRQGFYVDEADNVAKRLKPHAALVKAVCTHFANVEDVLEHEYADLQIKRFNTAREAFKKHGIACLGHAASSAATLILPESRFDICRVGISLYGLWPSQSTRLSYLQLNAKVLDLRPVLSWKTKIYLTKDVTAGTYIGYGCTFRANRSMRVAILPLGYNEGYPRLAGNNKSHVLIAGQRCPVIGRISMNLMVVDVSHLPNAKADDDVVLIGKQGDETISAEAIAGWAETIHYEFVTRIHPLIPRKIV